MQMHPINICSFKRFFDSKLETVSLKKVIKNHGKKLMT